MRYGLQTDQAHIESFDRRRLRPDERLAQGQELISVNEDLFHALAGSICANVGLVDCELRIPTGCFSLEKAYFKIFRRLTVSLLLA